MMSRDLNHCATAMRGHKLAVDVTLRSTVEHGGEPGLRWCWAACTQPISTGVGLDHSADVVGVAPASTPAAAKS